VPFAFATGDGIRTGLAAGFSGVGVNSHRTTGFALPSGTAGAAAAVVVVSVAASNVAATRTVVDLSDRIMHSR
jgi:hypothetical protein